MGIILVRHGKMLISWNFIHLWAFSVWNTPARN